MNIIIYKIFFKSRFHMGIWLAGLRVGAVLLCGSCCGIGGIA